MMRAAVVATVVLVLALGACEKDTRPPPFERDVTVQLTRRTPRVNERVLQVEETTLEASVNMQGHDVPWRWHKRTEMMFDVAAVDGYIVRSTRVTYKNIEESEEIAGKGQEHADAREGKTYVVMRDGELTTTYEDGRVPPDAERDEVLDENDSVGIEDATEVIIAEKTWTSGEKVVFTADELARINDRPIRAGGEKRTVRAMDMMLRSAKNGVATFDVGMVIDRELNGSKQSVQLRGDMRIEVATGHWLDMHTTGSMTGVYDGYPVNGSFKTRQETRWTAAPP